MPGWVVMNFFTCLHRLNLFSSIEPSWADKVSESHHSASRLFYLHFIHQSFPLGCLQGNPLGSQKSESMCQSYIYMICASLRAWRDLSLLNTSSQMFLSISLWALETGMNVMSSFGRLCCLSLLWFKATLQWKWVQDRLWELSRDVWQSAVWDTRWIGTGPSGSLWVGGRLMMDCGEIVFAMAKNPTTSV